MRVSQVTYKNIPILHWSRRWKAIWWRSSLISTSAIVLANWFKSPAVKKTSQTSLWQVDFRALHVDLRSSVLTIQVNSHHVIFFGGHIPCGLLGGSILEISFDWLSLGFCDGTRCCTRPSPERPRGSGKSISGFREFQDWLVPCWTR